MEGKATMDVCICGDGYGLALACPRHGQHLRRLAEPTASDVEDPVEVILKHVVEVEYGGTLDDRQVNLLRNGIRIGMRSKMAIEGWQLVHRMQTGLRYVIDEGNAQPSRVGLGDAQG